VAPRHPVVLSNSRLIRHEPKFLHCSHLALFTGLGSGSSGDSASEAGNARSLV
jgi:hypothetical protein